MKKVLVLLFLVVTLSQSFSQDNKKDYDFEFLPAGLNFLPLKAGIDEPRMGILYYSANTNMKVDIGNSFDIVGFNFKNSGTRITVGADFFAYAFVTSYLKYRLQIDAIDGYFGGNVAYSKELGNGRIVTRFRYIHCSSHMVDGHWDALKWQWIDSRPPTAYGNNYMELVLANELNHTKNYLRYYGGLSYSTGMTTKNKPLKRTIYKAGFEYAYENLFGKVFDKDENIFVAVNFDFKGIPKYVVNQNYLMGIKFGGWQGKGIVFYISYYNGGDVFNQYFEERVSRFGLGVMFDFL